MIDAQKISMLEGGLAAFYTLDYLDYFGSSAVALGDVNGDGFSDVIVGAFNYDNGEVNEGRAFVYHGSASGLATTPLDASRSR